jgi:Bacterial Ig-like domain (group 2)
MRSRDVLMRARQVSFLLLAALAAFSAACTDSPSPTSPSSGGVIAVTVSGTAPGVGAVAQFAATAALSNSSSRPVTGEATWQSSNTAVAMVSGGTVTGVSVGEADISASYQNVTGKLHITIALTPAAVTMVTVTGTAPDVGATSPFTANATLNDGTVQNVTSLSTWRSSNPSVATVSAGGVTGVAAGQADITATYQNATGSIHIAVIATACTFSVDPTSASVNSSGGLLRFFVFVSQQGTNCAWTATSSDPFVTITSGASGNGNGSVLISVSANSGASRAAFLTIAGRQATVSQAAGNCVTSVSPSSADYSAELKQGTVKVTAPAGCEWRATSLSAFITFNPIFASGSGDGSFTYRVFGNLTGAPRSGSLSMAQQTLTVTQHAALGGNFLSFVSDTGDYIGQGWTLLHEAPTSTFTPTIDAPRNHLAVGIIGSDGLRTLNWSLDLAAPQGQQLVPGTYLNATLWPFQAPTVPGLSFSGDGRGCNTLSGQFTVTDAVYAADGSVQRFSATFEQHCEGAGAALRGQIVYVR